jgi:protein PhnA
MSTRNSKEFLTERGMQSAERRIPALAAKAGHDAYRAALEHTGAVIVKTSRGQMVERKRDGSFTVIKDLPVGKRVKPGTVLTRVKQTG